MIADVLPLRTLPRGLDFFTYSVPLELEKTLQPGQAIKIPFRSQTLLGVVLKIRAGQAKNLKPILEIINPIPLLGPDYLDFLERLAKFYGVSMSGLVKSALPPLQSLKIANETIVEWKSTTRASQTPDYLWYANEDEQRAGYGNYQKERLAIIVPEVKDILSVHAALPLNRQAEAILWTSSDSQKNEREHWFAIRNSQAHTLIATRGALWLPLHQSFDRIVIEYEGDQNHKHWDQSPRFTTRDLAKMHARNFGLSYTEAGFSPSVSSYFFIQEKRYNLFDKRENKNNNQAKIILPDSGWAAPIFSPTIQKIENALETKPGQDIVLIFNQTKPGKVGICRDCTHVIATPLPEFCPNCGGINLKTIGHTIGTVANFLKKELDKTDAAIITVDKETELLDSEKSRIIIGTWAILGKITWSKISVAAILDFTRQALFAEYLTHEDLHYRIKQLQFFLADSAELLIQSETAEHPLLTALSKDQAWYESQLSERAELGFPPYSYLVRYLLPGKDEAGALKLAQVAVKRLEAGLTQAPKKCIIQGPLPASAKHQGKAWAIVMVKLSEPDILTAVSWLNQFFPTTAKIDPNPITVTSPH